MIMTENLQVKTQFDLEMASSHFLLGVMFVKSRSPSYQIALSIVKGSAHYYENTIEKTLFHFVLFEKTREEAIRAKALLSYAKGWRGTQVFAGGKGTESAYRALQVLECFATAAACKDHKAHCVVKVPDHLIHSEDIKKGPYLYPCRFMFGFYNHDIDPAHPSSVQDQFQASSIRRGCDWCPYLEIGAITKVARSNRAEGFGQVHF